MSDAFPQIEAGMRAGNGLGEHQNTFWGFYACSQCGHEADRRDHEWTFYCNWCELEIIKPAYRRPGKDGTIEYEEHVNPIIIDAYGF